MTCERYWREGVVLYERGVSDFHREGCHACQDAHSVLIAMAEALPLVGEDIVTDPLWKSKVLEVIDHEAAAAVVPASPISIDKPNRPGVPVEPVRDDKKSWFDRMRSWRWGWWLNGAAVGAAAALVVWLAVGRKQGEPATTVAKLDDVHYGITMSAGAVTKRSLSSDDKLPDGAKRYANQGDTFKITAHPDQEIRVYRDNRLLLRCPTPNPACSSDERSVTAQAVFDTVGDYQLVLIKMANGEQAPGFVGRYDDDLAKVVESGGSFEVTETEVH